MHIQFYVNPNGRYIEKFHDFPTKLENCFESILNSTFERLSMKHCQNIFIYTWHLWYRLWTRKCNKEKNVRAYCYGSHWDYGFVEVIVLTSWSIEKREKERKKRKTENSKQKKYTTQILHCSCASLNQKGIGLANLPDECSPLGFPIFFSALILNCFLLVRLFFRSYFFFFHLSWLCVKVPENMWNW